MLAGQHGGEDFSPYWDNNNDASALDDFEFCDCPGPPPPPKFVIPPPPPSPSSPLCQAARPGSHPEDNQQPPPVIQFCSLEPVGAEFTQVAFPSLPIIAVCSSIVLVAVLVASFLLWKHKRKVQNFLPCKNQNRCDMPIGPTGGITYDDVLINHHPTRLPNHHNHPPGPTPLTTTDTLTPIELLDVKYASYIQQHSDPLTGANFTLPPSNKEHRVAATNGRPNVCGTEPQKRNSHHQQQRNHRNQKKKDPFHPIYEEVSAASDDKVQSNGHSYDSDIEDSEVEGRTVGSEDEFAEDELSVAGEYQPSNQEGEPSQPESTTSSLRGSTGGDLYPDVVSGSSERFCASADSENRALKSVLRGLELGNALKKHTHSLERNKDGHPSNSFQAKQNYYLNKSMLGPDFTFSGEGDADAVARLESGGTVPVSGQQDVCAYPGSRSMGAALNFVGPSPAIQQSQHRTSNNASRSASSSPPPPPYAACIGTGRLIPGNNNGQASNAGGSNREIIAALYNPQVVSPTMSSGRLPDSLLRELAFKLPGAKPQGVPVVSLTSAAAMSSRSLPVPPSCRAAGTGVLFTVDNPYPPQTMSRARSGSATEFGYHPYGPHIMGTGRPPTPPPPENIYASIDDDGPFTIDGSRHRVSTFGQARKGSAEFRNTFGKNKPLAAKVGNNEQGMYELHGRSREQDPSSSYGDLRSNFDARTACS